MTIRDIMGKVYQQMKYAYCRKWFEAQKRPLEMWDEETARTAHDEQRPYTVLVGESECPTASIQAAKQFFGVSFFDAKLRNHLSYQFQELEPGRLFLSMAVHREFEGDSDVVASGTCYIFKTNGDVIVDDYDGPTGEVLRREKKADVSGNWGPYPQFGAYSSLLQIERASSPFGK